MDILEKPDNLNLIPFPNFHFTRSCTKKNNDAFSSATLTLAGASVDFCKGRLTLTLPVKRRRQYGRCFLAIFHVHRALGAFDLVVDAVVTSLVVVVSAQPL